MRKDFFQKLTQRKLNNFFKNTDITAELLQYSSYDVQGFGNVPGIIYINGELDKEKYKEFINEAYYSEFVLINKNGFINDCDRENYKEYEEYYVNKCDKQFIPRLTFEQSSRYRDIMSYVKEIRKIKNDRRYVYVTFRLDFLYDLKFNPENLNNYIKLENGTNVYIDFYGVWYENHLQCKLFCENIIDGGFGDFLTTDKILPENIYIKIPASKDFNYHKFIWKPLIESSIEDIELSKKFEEYLLNEIKKSDNYDLLNKLRLFDNQIPEDESNYIDKYALAHGYKEVEVPEVVWFNMIDDVQFYDAQGDPWYGFLSKYDGYEITLEKRDRNSMPIYSKNIKVWKRDGKMVTFSFVGFSDYCENIM